jgi:DNA invertase Pin-like site-specific DNA recombinase
LLADAERGKFQTVFVLRLDRFSRSVADAVDVLARLERCGVSVVSLTETWCDGTTAQGKFMRVVVLGLAEFERELIRTRTREGLARARAQGKRLGRPHRLNGEFEALRADMEAGRVSQREAARRLGVSARTIARALRHNGGPTEHAPSLADQGFADAAGDD